MTAVALQYRDLIIEELANGKRLSDLTQTVGVSHQAISAALKSDPEYRAAIQIGFHKRLDVAEVDLETAEDNIAVARARARFQSVAWRAERECPDTWGAKQEIKHTGTLSLAVLLAAKREQVVADVPNGAALRDDTSEDAE